MKRCSGPCGQEKPLEAFYPRKDALDGHRGTCIECWLAHYKPGKRASYAKHRERILLERKAQRGTLDKVRLTPQEKIERNRAWSIADYYRHHEKRKAADRAYYWRNRDSIREKARVYRAENAEYCRLRDFKWRILNPEKVKAKHRRYYFRHRERILAAAQVRYRQRYRPANSLDYGYSKGFSHDRRQYAVYRDHASQAERQAACVEFLDKLAYCLNDEQAAFLMALEQAEGNADDAAKTLGVNVSLLDEIRQIARRLDARPI